MPCNVNKRSWARPLSELRADTGLASDADLTALLVARHQGGTSLIWGCRPSQPVKFRGADGGASNAAIGRRRGVFDLFHQPLHMWMHENFGLRELPGAGIAVTLRRFTAVNGA